MLWLWKVLSPLESVSYLVSTGEREREKEREREREREILFFNFALDLYEMDRPSCLSIDDEIKRKKRKRNIHPRESFIEKHIEKLRSARPHL